MSNSNTPEELQWQIGDVNYEGYVENYQKDGSVSVILTSINDERVRAYQVVVRSAAQLDLTRSISFTELNSAFFRDVKHLMLSYASFGASGLTLGEYRKKVREVAIKLHQMPNRPLHIGLDLLNEP